MRVLVTGGAGVVGGAIVPHLATRHEVVILDRLAPPRPTVRSVTADLRSWRQVRNALESHGPLDAVVHLATAPSLPYRSEDRDVTELEVSVTGTWVMLTEAHRLGARRFLHASSVNVYGDVLHDGLLHDEGTDMWATNTIDGAEPYGLAKLIAERMIGYFCRSRECSGAAFRLDAVHSPGIMERRGVHVDDIASAFLAALDADLEGFEIYNLTADPTRHRAPIDKVVSRFGWEPLHRFERRPDLEDWSLSDVPPLGRLTEETPND